MNWLERHGFTLIEHRGPFRQRGNEVLVDRRYSAVGELLTLGQLEDSWHLGPGVDLTELADDTAGRTIRIRDGVQEHNDRYSVDLRMTVPGARLTNDDRDSVLTESMQLSAALAITPDWNGRDVPAEHPAAHAWGRLPYLVQALERSGGKVAVRDPYRRLSNAVEHTGSILMRGRDSLDDLRLPEHMALERLSSGAVLIRDFPGGFASDRARFALVLELER